MAKPASRQELIDYCLRRLGAPVLEINVDDDQIDDLVDDALQYFNERHFDGVERMYLKYKISQDDINRGSAKGTNGVGIVTTSNVGIATTNPTSPLTVFGDALIIGIVTATDFNSASDIKLKDNISVIDNPLDKIVKLEGVNFQWKETGKKSLGVIAQEVEKVLPELVSGEESKTVNYNGLIGLLIECVKYQQKEIEELKKFIDK